jgi:hypothetical protein
LDKGLSSVLNISPIGTAAKNLAASKIKVYTIPKVVATDISAIAKKNIGIILSDLYFLFLILVWIISLTFLLSIAFLSQAFYLKHVGMRGFCPSFPGFLSIFYFIASSCE